MPAGSTTRPPASFWKCMIPQITHQQFLVLDLLASGSLNGAELREKLEATGLSRSGPSFYQFMARLEKEKLVHGEYRVNIEDGQRVRERVYSILIRGRLKRGETLTFYLDRKGMRK